MDDRIIRYYNHLLNPEEQRQFLNEAFENPVLKCDLMAVENVQALCNLHPAQKDEQEGNDSYAKFRSRLVRRQHYTIGLRLLKYAAIFFVGVFISWMLALQFRSADNVTTVQELSVPQGQRARIVLPDGSVAWVNSGSTLRYPSVFVGERQIELIGEASFDVVKNTEKPFKVAVSGNIVKVLGTHFNVCGYARKPLTVALLRGKVRVYSAAEPAKGVILSPNQEVTVSDGRYVVRSLEENPTLWHQGILSFRNASMKELAEKLEAYYNVRITIANPSVERYTFTGKLRQGNNVRHVLQLLQEIHPFRVEYDASEENIRIY